MGVVIIFWFGGCLTAVLRYFCLFVALGCCVGKLFATQPIQRVRQSAVAQVKPWNGESISRKEGGVFFNIAIKTFHLKRFGRDTSHNVQITIENIKSLKRYSLVYPMDKSFGVRQSAVWRLPVGRYAVSGIHVSLGDRVWQWRGKRHFVVESLSLANLGYWDIALPDRKQIRVSFRMAALKPFDLQNIKKAFKRVDDGFNGRPQSILSNKSAQGKKRSAGSALTVVKNKVVAHKYISVQYLLNLADQNRETKQLMQALQLKEPVFRACYEDQLEVTPHLQGKMKFRLILSSKTGGVARLTRMGGNIREKRFSECVFYELTRLVFPVRRKVEGHLTFLFTTSVH